MKKTIFLFVIILFYLPSILFSNEKQAICNINVFSIKNEFINASGISLTEFGEKNNKILNKDYNNIANGYLVMGINGIIIVSLVVPAFAASIPVIALTILGEILFILVPIIFMLPFLAIGLPLTIVGFVNYKKYKYSRNPSPFDESEKQKNILNLDFKISLWN